MPTVILPVSTPITTPHHAAATLATLSYPCHSYSSSSFTPYLWKSVPAPGQKLSSTQARGSAQSADCYDYNNGGGDRMRATDYIPALRTYNFDNKIGSCCLTGIWILYGEEDYNGYSTGSANWWAYGDNTCLDVPSQFDNKASSLRFTGAPDDWKYDTLNLYFNDYFIGDEEFTYNDMSQLNYDNRAKSVIVTGCSPWTLYQYDNYSGDAMCVFPSDSSSCTPGLYPTYQSLGSLAGQVSSVRKGCYARSKVYPHNDGTKKDEKGASGLFKTRN